MENKIKNLRSNLNEKDLLEQQSLFLKQSKNDPTFQPNFSKIIKSENCLNNELKINSDKVEKNEEEINIFMALDIIEHDTSSFKSESIKSNVGNLNPSMKIDKNWLKEATKIQPDETGKKKSLFSKFLDQKKISQKSNNSSKYNSCLTDGSGLGLSKEKALEELKEIQEQNDELLSKITDEEKNDLIEQFNIKNFDPKLIKFIKNRQIKKKPNNNLIPIETSKLESLQVTEKKLCLEKTVNDYNLNSSDFYISQDEIIKNKYLNMDKFEKEKLEWIKPLLENEKKKENLSIEGKAARFKFDGDLVTKEEGTRQGLHHHNEQEDSAGYTINELLRFLKSKFVPQKILALNTLANVFKRMHRGYYDICFNEPLIIQVIEETDVLIVLRKLLDEKNLSLVLTVIKCIYALICNTIYDEFCLDRLFCSMELGIEIPKLSYQKIDKEYKDDQLCKIDVIECLIRMNFLPRIRYLIDNFEIINDTMAVDNILDILIRVSRHSIKSCEEILNTPFLMETLINNFISIKSSYINWKAIKLIRILFTTDKKFILEVKKKYSFIWTIFRNYLVMNPISSFENTSEKSSFFLTIIEILRVWRVLLILDNDSNETSEQFIELAMNIKNCFDIKIFVNNNFDLHYVSNLVHCLSYAIKKTPSYENYFTPLVQNLTFKWIRQIIDYNEIPDLDGSLALSSAIMYLSHSNTEKELLLQNILDPIFKKENYLLKVSDLLLLNSSILYYKEYFNSIYRDSKALPSYGSIYFGGTTIKLNQLLNEKSMIFFLGSVISIASKNDFKIFLQKFLYSENMKKYFSDITKTVKKSQNLTIFELIELNTISQFLLWESNVLKENNYFDCCLHILPFIADIQLKNLIFNYVFDVKVYKKVFDKQEKTNDEISNHFIKTSISFFNEIKKTYVKYSSLEDENWIFEPLVQVFKLQNNINCELSEDEISKNLINCLYYILLVYNLKKDFLFSILEPKILFVYFSSIFLFKNGIFLNNEILKILKYMFLELIKVPTVLFNCFEEKLPEPFENIGSFFNDLCINFKTESYGNNIYSNYILFFFKQNSDKIFLKKILDEHNSSLFYLVLHKEELLFDLNQLMNPVESNFSIIESFVRVLLAKDITKERNSLFYEYCISHISKALFDETFKENRLKNLEIFKKLISCIKYSNNEQLKKDILQKDFQKLC